MKLVVCQKRTAYAVDGELLATKQSGVQSVVLCVRIMQGGGAAHWT